MSMFTHHFLLDHFQFALIHGTNIPGSYAVLLFTALDFTSITSRIHNWALFLLWLHLFILELFLHWSPVTYWAPTDLGSSSFSVLSFCLTILFMGFSRQEYWSDLLFLSPVNHVLGLHWWLRWQSICLQCGRPGFDLWVGKIPWEGLLTPIFWPGEFHGQAKLVWSVELQGFSYIRK